MSREYPCIYFDNERCKKFSEDGYKSWCVLGPCGHETPSNADRIRVMSDEELAIEIHAFTLGWRGRSDWCDFGCNYPCENGCDKCILKWLKQPAKEDA